VPHRPADTVNSTPADIALKTGDFSACLFRGKTIMGEQEAQDPVTLNAIFRLPLSGCGEPDPLIGRTGEGTFLCQFPDSLRNGRGIHPKPCSKVAGPDKPVMLVNEFQVIDFPGREPGPIAIIHTVVF
jgi:hypothetical protein